MAEGTALRSRVPHKWHARLWSSGGGSDPSIDCHHHLQGSQKAFVIGRAHVYHLVPSQRRAPHAGHGVMVGFGAAGAATAITVYEAGATAILLDKAPQGHEGGNTRVAGQGYLNTSSVEKAVTYRASGSFNIQGVYGVVQGISPKYCRRLWRNAGYAYVLPPKASPDLTGGPAAGN